MPSVLSFAERHALLLAELEVLTSAMTGPPLPCPLNIAQTLHLSSSPPLTFLTWNVRGIQSRLSNLQPILQQSCPAVCILTETKLRPCQHQRSWLRDSMPSYTPIYSSFPSPAGSAKAGVLLALHHSLNHPHVLTVHQTPTHLQGYLVHIHLSLPRSKPLHILGVYQETAHDLRADIQDSIFEYINNLTPDGFTNDGDNILIGGDFNATLFDTDRNPSRATTSSFDTQYRRKLHDTNLDTAFRHHPGPRSHSFSQDREPSPSTSRIDDWLCSHGTLDNYVIHTQPQILQSPYTEGSDHCLYYFRSHMPPYLPAQSRKHHLHSPDLLSSFVPLPKSLFLSGNVCAMLPTACRPTLSLLLSHNASLRPKTTQLLPLLPLNSINGIKMSLLASTVPFR